MKRILAVCLILAFCLAVFACQHSANTSVNNSRTSITNKSTTINQNTNSSTVVSP